MVGPKLVANIVTAAVQPHSLGKMLAAGKVPVTIASGGGKQL